MSILGYQNTLDEETVGGSEPDGDPLPAYVCDPTMEKCPTTPAKL